MGLFSRASKALDILVHGAPTPPGRMIQRGATASSQATRNRTGDEWLEAYNQQPWLRATVGKIAQGMAGIQWGLTQTLDPVTMKTTRRRDIQGGTHDYRRKAIAALMEDEAAKPIFEHPLLELWKHPCPWLQGNAFQLIAQVYYEIQGEVFMVIDRSSSARLKSAITPYSKSDFTGKALPRALYILPPSWVRRTPTPDRETFEFRFNQLQVPDFPMSEVLWLKNPDPMNPYARGMGAVVSLADELDADENAAKMVSFSFYNRARPDAIVNLPDFEDDDLTAFRNDWIANLQGVRNTLKTHFVNAEKMSVEKLGFDFQQMEVPELREYLRDTIRQVQGIPPEILGILDNSNRSTIEAAEYLFGKYVLVPRAEIWRDFLQEALVPEFDPRATIDYVSPLQEDKNFALNVLAAKPVIAKVKEYRKLAGLPPTDDPADGEFYITDDGRAIKNLAELAAVAPGVTPGAPGGGGIPGIPDGGIFVPGAPAMPIHVDGADAAQKALPPGAPPGTPQAAQAPPFQLDIKVSHANPILKAIRPLRVTHELAASRTSPDEATAIALWTKHVGGVNLRLLTRSEPGPVGGDGFTEYLRRALAHLDGIPTKGWDHAFGPWDEYDDHLLDCMTGTKEFEPADRPIFKDFDEAAHPRNELGQFGEAGGQPAAKPAEQAPAPAKKPFETQQGQRIRVGGKFVRRDGVKLPPKPKVKKEPPKPDALKPEPHVKVKPNPKADAKLDRGPSEDKMESTPVDKGKVYSLGGGVAGSYIAELPDGSKAVWKPNDEEAGMPGGRKDLVGARIRDFHTPGQQTEREVGAWVVAKAVGLDDIASPVVVKEIDGKRGALMAFQAGDVAKKVYGFDDPKRYDGRDDLLRAAVFDYVIGNSDRHGGNWMLADPKGADRIRLIDHGYAFPEGEKISSGNHAFMSRVYGDMDQEFRQAGSSRYKYADEDVRQAVKPYFGKIEEIRDRLEKLGMNKASIDGMVARMKKVTEWKSVKQASRAFRHFRD